MKSLLMISVPFAIFCLLTVTVRAEQLLYLASTQEKTIVAYAIQSDTGTLGKQFSVDLPGSAGPLTFSPDTAFVYAAVTGLATRAAT